MNFNSIIFPAPESCYEYRLVENILWIPRKTSNNKESIDKSKQNPDNKSENGSVSKSKETKETKGKTSGTPESEDVIPCLHLSHGDGSDKILIYFHGNSEDIGWAHEFVYSLKEQLKVDIISMEYPGYGLYIGEPSSERILRDAEILFDFLVDKMGFLSRNIFLFGRSIGSGPATYLASRKKPGAMFLMSPYTCIKDIARGVAGKFGAFMIAERFRNIDEIKNSECPVLFIHGLKDKLIPFSHSVELLNNCPNICDLHLSENMDHNDFVMEDDVTNPILKFLEKCDIKINTGKKLYTFPEELYEQPEGLKGKKNNRSVLAKIAERYS